MNSNNPAKYLLFLIILSNFLFAQKDVYKTPKDTSYTLKSAFEKISNNYPDIELKRVDEKGIIVYKDLVYQKYNKRALHLDLYLPSNYLNKSFPLVILIHGGGWASGNKKLLESLARELSKNNFVSAAIEYRLSPEAQYPAALIDIKSAIKWMKVRADRYGIDTSKVALLGTSAGGHLAALAGNTSTIKKYESSDQPRDVSSRVQAIIDIDGVLDFTDPAESGKDTSDTKPSVGRRWLGYTYKENPKIWEEVSPINYVTSGTPPILFVNSSRPRFHAGRDEMITEMDKLGIYSEVHTLENSPHSFWLFDPWFDPTTKYIVKFLNKIFN